MKKHVTYLSLFSVSESLPLSCLDGDAGSFLTFGCLPSSSERDFGTSFSFEVLSCFTGFSFFTFSELFSAFPSLLKI